MVQKMMRILLTEFLALGVLMLSSTISEPQISVVLVLSCVAVFMLGLTITRQDHVIMV